MISKLKYWMGYPHRDTPAGLTHFENAIFMAYMEASNTEKTRLEHTFPELFSETFQAPN